MHLAFIQYDPLFLPRRSQARRDCRRLRLREFVRLSLKAPNTLTLLQVDGKLRTEARDALAGVAESSRLKGGDSSYTVYCLDGPKYRIDLRVCSWFSFAVEGTFP